MVTRPPRSAAGSVPHERQHHSSGAAALAVPPGTLLIGTYEIMEHLNTGGMGEVYRGVNIHNDEVVAIKIVLPALAHDEKILSLFQKESTVLRRIAHDAIVRYEVFTRDPALDRPCLIMEYAEGPSLGDRLEQEPLDLAEVLVLLRRLTSGLDVAHRGGVVHRDLSPDNVILCGSEVAQAKIIDFGIAKASTPGGRTLIGGQFAGKPGYVAPEQLGLYEGHVTGQADIYSLGLLAAAAALGHPLDMGDSPAAAVMARIKVPDLTGIDPELVPLLEWMLQPDPAHRPGSMAEINAWILTHFADLVTESDPGQGMGPITISPQPLPPRSRGVAENTTAPSMAQTATSSPPKPARSSRPPAAYQPTVLAERPAMPPPADRPDPTPFAPETTPPSAPPVSAPPEPVPTAPPVTVPPVTAPPVSQPPASQPPLSQPPVAPASLPPASLPPVTAPPVTAPPVTAPPVTAPPVTAPPIAAPQITNPPLRTQPPMTAPPPPSHVTGTGPVDSASPFGPGPVTSPPPAAVTDRAEPRKGLPILPIAAVLGLALVGGGVWMSGILQSGDPAPQIAAAPPQAPDPASAPQPAPPDPQELQAWLDGRIASGPPAPCSWMPRGSTVTNPRGFADSPAAFAPLQAAFEAEFNQSLPLRVHPLSAAQCPAFTRIAALEQGRPPSGRLGFGLPEQLVQGSDSALTGRLSGQISGELTVLMIDPAGRVQNITDLIEGGSFQLSGQRITPPEDESATGAEPAVFALLALDTATPLPVMRALPGNAILPSGNAEEFWRLLGDNLDALPEPPDFAHGVVIWSQ